MPVLIKYRQYVIVNIANEWREDYKVIISMFRNAGYSGELIIDSSNNQDPTSVVLYGNDLVSYDPFHNIILSIHRYARWYFKNYNFIFFQYYEALIFIHVIY